jgi:murein DD-endopeptidase MepM/ murein hydrolase activator NlpD
MNSSSSGEWLERFFAGKGFYIVLFLCAAVIGGSAWMLATGGSSPAEEKVEVSNTRPETWVETGQLPSHREDLPIEEPVVVKPAQTAVEPEEEPAQEVFSEQPAAVNPVYEWPLQGEVDRFHDPDTLRYDETLGDWRVHEGIDILAPLGETVTAAHAGSVESVKQSDLYGTMVIVSHGDGFRTIYANLEEHPAVSVGDWVEPGSLIGTVGASALCEIGQASHLHFAVTCNGVNQNPLDYLPA